MTRDGVHGYGPAEAIMTMASQGAAGVRVAERTSGHVERALARRGDLVQVFDHCRDGATAAPDGPAMLRRAFFDSTPSALDPSAEPP